MHLNEVYWLMAQAVDARNVGLPRVQATDADIRTALQIAFGIIGVAAVIFVMIGGLKFITSQGDPQQAGKARQTVIYAVIGLVIALMAEAIVSFTIGRL